MEGKNNNTPINITLTAEKGKVHKVKIAVLFIKQRKSISYTEQLRQACFKASYKKKKRKPMGIVNS